MFDRYISVVLAISLIPQSLPAEVLTFYDALFEITNEEDYVAWANRTSGVYRFVRPFGPFHSARFLAAQIGDGMVVQMRMATNGVDNAKQAIDNLEDEIGEMLKPFYRRLEFENVATNDVDVCISKRGVDCCNNILSVGVKKTGKDESCLLFCELKPSLPMSTGIEDVTLTSEAVMDALRTESIGPFIFTNTDPSVALLDISQACVDKVLLHTGKDVEFYASLCKTNNLSFFCPATNCISVLSLIANRLNLSLEIDGAVHLSPR